MTAAKSTNVLSLLESFFRNHLIGARGVSPHTIRSYRDTLRLFFSFLAEEEGKNLEKLQLDDINVKSVANFLIHIETKRNNSAVSRNCRLAVIRSFAKHLMRNDLQRANQYQQILALPSKKIQVPIATYLEPHEVQIILKQPDRRTTTGLRHYALLLFLYNTGVRVSEALAVQAGDLHLYSPRQVIVHGKGKKDRLCPLWKDTVKALQRLPSVQSGSNGNYVFNNRFGRTLSRDGVAYIINKYVKLAENDISNLRRRNITPHCMRHSCAVALLQSGVDITVIRDYLGHASITTTNRYITTNLQMKREALEKFWSHSGLTPTKPSPWKPSPDVLNFLASL